MAVSALTSQTLFHGDHLEPETGKDLLQVASVAALCFRVYLLAKKNSVSVYSDGSGQGLIRYEQSSAVAFWNVILISGREIRNCRLMRRSFEVQDRMKT